MTKRPAIFLDRDGTLIEEVNYLSHVEDLRLFPFSAEAVTQLKDAGFLIIVVTNQSGIGRGIYTEADMHAIHAAIQKELDGAIDAFYFCPHLPCDGCECRKPKLGMIEAAMRDVAIDLENSWMVGDKKIDVETGQAAGMSTALVLTGYGMQHDALLEVGPTLISADLGAAASELLRISKRFHV
jgi:D-glycero-D-manno-heptose 1,7-bisphosphate phosphatase